MTIILVGGGETTQCRQSTDVEDYFRQCHQNQIIVGQEIFITAHAQFVNLLWSLNKKRVYFKSKSYSI